MNNLLLKRFAAAMPALLFTILCGCETSTSQQAESKTEKSIPKQRFHLPKTYPKGVQRIRELFDVVSGDGELPEPISYQVLEIMHGTGAAAHSHYHLLEGSTKTDQVFEDDGHETTGEKTHTIVVDWSSELTDLAQWLPKIAVGGDMNEENWLKVRDLSASLSTELETMLRDTNDAKSKRDSLKEHEKTIAEKIVKLENLIPKPTNPQTVK